MIGNLLKIGDKVRIVVPEPNEYTDYVGFRSFNGKEATIREFGEIERSYASGNPGVFVNPEWVKLDCIVGPGANGSFPVSWIALCAEDEQKRREESWQGVNDPRFESRFLRPLPDTPFWEGDMVKIVRPGPHYGETLEVKWIEYKFLGKFRSDGSPALSYSCGGIFFAANDLKLEQRGAIWAAYQAGYQAGKQAIR